MIESALVSRLLLTNTKTLQNTLLLLSMTCALPLAAQSNESSTELDTLKEMSIEGLLGLEVTSVSKKAQSLWGSAAAIYVIDAERIRRSGATSIPELLRLAPGVHVAKINANSWAITARGFNGRFSNKLLVAIDGRSVYTPLYSGVYWDVQDTVIADIERIEVIRGPGATVWGANAVNGVINIITKNSADTTGGHILARVGSEERSAGEFRYGGKLDEKSHYRIYGKSFNRDSSKDELGHDAFDSWDGKQGGFRIDSEITAVDSMRLQSDFYQGDSGQSVTLRAGSFADTVDRSGGNLLFSWDRILGEESGLHFQAYYDRTKRADAVTAEERDTFDLELTHFFRFGDQHNINWGLGYRHSADELTPVQGSSVNFNSTDQTTVTWSGFIQDEIALITDELSATLGVKLENNEYTGWEVQPSARLAWMPNESLTLWGAVSVAIRSPSRVENDFSLQIPSFPAGYSILGNTEFESENLTAYEIGFRKRLNSSLILDTAFFYNQYDDLRSVEFRGMAVPNTPPYGLPSTAPIWLVNQFANGMNGDSYGVEVSLDWEINPDWKISTNYSYLKLDLDLEEHSTDVLSQDMTGNNPEHQFQIHSMWNLSPTLEFDASLSYVSDLYLADISNYTRVDLRLAWFPRKNIETTLVLQNVLDETHTEFVVDEGLQTRAVERAIYGQVTWKF